MQFFILLFVFFILIFFGVIGLIVWVVIKSQKKSVGDEARQERFELIDSVLARRGELAPWEDYSVEDLRPYASYKYVKALKNTFSGKLIADNGQYILTFKRVESGFYSTGSIAAATSSFELFFIIEKDRTEFYYNRMKIGTVLKNGTIFNREGKQIGTVNRSNTSTISIGGLVDVHTGSAHYDFNMNNRLLAIFYVTPRISNSFGDSLFSINENSGNRIIQQIDKPQEDEKKWLISWTVFEVVYHGFWFTEI